MYYELALASVIVAGVYWGWFFVSKQPHGSATFGLMQLGAALCAGLGFVAHRSDEPARWMEMAGAIGVGAGTCLLVVGPLVRGLGRRFAAAERLGIARRLLDLAEILAPGSGVSDEKALIGAMQEIRDGHIEQTVDALTAAKDRAPAEARLAIDERIAMLYLAAYRWSDAIAHAEATLFGAMPGTIEVPVDGRPQSLRRSLGIAPPVWVELLGAYGRTGDLDRAARMLARLEDVCEGREEAAVWIHRGRLMFLALAGRTAAVQALVTPRQASHMSPSVRSYWLGVAHEHGGDRVAAGVAYQRAQKRSRGRPRDLVDQALSNLAKREGLPVELSDEARDVVARVEAAPLPPPIRTPSAPKPYATYSLTLAMLAAAGVVALAVGPTNDVGVLTRAGALVRGLVDGGEWWRVFSCVFIHVGGLHLIVNAIGMALVGRIAEEMFGTARTFAVFGVAAFAGSVATYLASSAGISAGASGGLFGLLGAVALEMTWHRRRYRDAWKRGMGWALVVVIVAELGHGFVYPVVDQWAHGAGLVAGALIGALLSPHAKWAKAGLQVGRVIAALFIVFSVLAGVRVARTSIDDSFTRLPRHERAAQIDGLQVASPVGWSTDGELAEPDGLVMLVPRRVPVTDFAGQLGIWIAADAPAMAKAHGFETVEPAAAPMVALPKGWEGKELVATFEDPMGYRQRYRVIAAGKKFGGDIVTVAVITPETIAVTAPGFMTFLISSVKP